jgi:hypothetical protein
MALPLTESAADHEAATQESMFDDPTGYPELEAYEAADEPSDDPAFETVRDFSEDAPESASSESVPNSGNEPVSTGTEVVHTDESHSEPTAESAESVETASSPDSTSSPAVAAEPESMTVLTVDDFSALEERVLRAVSLVRRERQARVAAEERATALEVEVQAQIPAIERLQQEVDSLRAEREQVRLRVERLLSQLDAMEL